MIGTPKVELKGVDKKEGTIPVNPRGNKDKDAENTIPVNPRRNKGKDAASMRAGNQYRSEEFFKEEKEKV